MLTALLSAKQFRLPKERSQRALATVRFEFDLCVFPRQ